MEAQRARRDLAGAAARAARAAGAVAAATLRRALAEHVAALPAARPPRHRLRRVPLGAVRRADGEERARLERRRRRDRDVRRPLRDRRGRGRLDAARSGGMRNVLFVLEPLGTGKAWRTLAIAEQLKLLFPAIEPRFLAGPAAATLLRGAGLLHVDDTLSPILPPRDAKRSGAASTVTTDHGGDSLAALAE